MNSAMPVRGSHLITIGSSDRVDQRHSQALRRHGGERANADAYHHGQEHFQLKEIEEASYGRVEQRNFHIDNIPA